MENETVANLIAQLQVAEDLANKVAAAQRLADFVITEEEEGGLPGRDIPALLHQHGAVLIELLCSKEKVLQQLATIILSESLQWPGDSPAHHIPFELLHELRLGRLEAPAVELLSGIIESYIRNAKDAGYENWVADLILLHGDENPLVRRTILLSLILAGLASNLSDIFIGHLTAASEPEPAVRIVAFAGLIHKIEYIQASLAALHEAMFGDDPELSAIAQNALAAFDSDQYERELDSALTATVTRATA